MAEERKKIYINKNDDIAVVIAKLTDAPAHDVVLHVPRFSRLAANPSHVYLLKRESETQGKTLAIESVDDDVLASANEAGIPAENPFFAGAKKSVTDIVTLPKRRPRVSRAATVDATLARSKAARMEEPPEADALSAPVPETQEEIARELDAQFGPLQDSTRKKHSAAFYTRLIVGALFAGGATVAAAMMLPRATINIVAQKAEWPYQETLTADTSLKAPEAGSARIPGQVFAERRNVTLAFPASGKRQVSEKAGGKITVFNALSSEPQKLVATTRFATADGKIYRLTAPVTVPGAKIVDGKIVPSSIDADVRADAPGVAYNLAPGVSFSIPGFKGTPKYNAFRGESKTAITGGYVGELAYPTDEDIKKAKAAIAGTLGDGLKAAVLAKAPPEFKTLEGGSQLNIVKQTVGSEVNATGAFTVTAEAELSVMGFREADVRTAIRGMLAKKNPDTYPLYTTTSETVSYNGPRFDAVAGRMSFAVDYKAASAYAIEPSALRGKILSKSERELRAMVLGVPGIASARIELWPFWVRSVPKNAEKVTISVQ
ncbi:MAG: hypothetical protein HYZ07_00655 [Candidatus Harrisonbacteria bacterium]|nr:hypothetical protein [Candidatus Harrisonbacteria bacterium]